jgi:hypothetical protein
MLLQRATTLCAQNGRRANDLLEGDVMSDSGTENEKLVFGLSGLKFADMLAKALRIASQQANKRDKMLRPVTEYMVTRLHVFMAG